MNQDFSIDQQEIWLPVVDYKGLYEMSNRGRVKSEYTKRILKPSKSSNGYLKVVLCKNKAKKTFLIHRLVMTSFKPDLFADQYQINHRNEQKTDNRVENLEWVSPKYNINYGTGIERCSKANSKTVLQFTLDGDLVREWSSTNEAGRNGYIQGHVAACCRGERHTHKGYIWKFKEAS